MMGRPPKPKDKVRNVTFRIRVTQAERDSLDRAAAEGGEEASTWARALLLRAAQKAAIARKPRKSVAKSA